MSGVAGEGRGEPIPFDGKELRLDLGMEVVTCLGKGFNGLMIGGMEMSLLGMVGRGLGYQEPAPESLNTPKSVFTLTCFRLGRGVAELLTESL